MSQYKLTKDAWNAIVTTTVDTLFGVEGGDVRFQTENTAALDLSDGHLIRQGSSIVFPTGLPVEASTLSSGVTITAIKFGV